MSPGVRGIDVIPAARRDLTGRTVIYAPQPHAIERPL